MKKNTEISARILQILDYYKVNANEFAKKLGYDRSQTVYDVLNSKSAPSFDFFNRLLNSEYSVINSNWLLTGKGSMLTDEISLSSHRINELKSELNKDAVYPIVSVESIAGFGSSDFAIQKSDIVDYCTIPLFKNRKVDFLVPIRGKSMEPVYQSGDLVACKILTEKTFIQWNEIHVIGTREQGILLKRLRKSKIENHLLAISDNPDFDPFDIPEDEITGIALVVGSVRLE